MKKEEYKAVARRARKAKRALLEGLDVYMKEEPSWRALTLLEVARGALASLRHYIENEKDPDITWREPFVELHFPVEWDFGERCGPTYGARSITAEDLKSDRRTVEKLTEVFLQTRDYTFLHGLTRKAVYFKSGNSYEGRLAAEELEEVEKLPEAEQDAAFVERFRPYTVSAPGNEWGLTFSGDVEGEPVAGAAVLEVYPLVVDEGERRAYFPVVAGLAFEEGSPEAWSPKDRREFWEPLLRKLESLHEEWSGKRDEAEPPALPTPEVRPRTFPLAFGRALGDEDALAFVRNVHKVRLPKRWSSFPAWTELEKAERDRILEEEGETAFEDLRETTGDPDSRGKLLKRRYRKGGTEEVVSLTAEAERRLKIREGLKGGFRYLDKYGKEYLVRLFQVGGGYLEVGLSWYGLAGPWVEGWRKDLEAQTEAIAAGSRQGLLFEDLDEDRRRRVDVLVRRLQALKDGRELMELVLGQVGRQARNPVRVPAEAFRVLLNLERDRNWKARVEGGLEALRACEFRLDSFEMTKVRGYGSFLAEWYYVGAGPGDHASGDYFLSVTPGFLGCLHVFESGKRKLSSGREVTAYDFGRKPSREDRKALGWTPGTKTEASFSGFDAGRVFYNAAEGLTPAQRNLVGFLERELTERRDGVSRTLGDHAARKAARSRPKAPDAHEPRLYSRADCPLLPEGRNYHGALGHFRKNPEAGRTLYGTRTRASATGGGHTEGLLSVLGHELKPGAAHAERARVVREALEDFKAVVEDYLEGVVAARGPDGAWLTLERASSFSEPDLGKRTRWFFFLPETWREDRKRKWEAHMEKRAAEHGTPAWKATEDPVEAERAREALKAEARGETVVDESSRPLRHRLRAARLERGLSLAETGKLFGVSHAALSKWETGTEPDEEDGRVRGKPIPAELVPLVLRWVETGEAPAEENLAARKTRRSGVRKPGLSTYPVTSRSEKKGGV